MRQVLHFTNLFARGVEISSKPNIMFFSLLVENSTIIPIISTSSFNSRNRGVVVYSVENFSFSTLFAHSLRSLCVRVCAHVCLCQALMLSKSVLQTYHPFLILTLHSLLFSSSFCTHHVMQTRLILSCDSESISLRT